MQPGPDNDFNRIYLYVNVIDDFWGSTLYNLTDPIIVLSNAEFENSLISQINSNDKSSVFMQEIVTGSIKYSNNILAIGNILNQESQNSDDPKVSFNISFISKL